MLLAAVFCMLLVASGTEVGIELEPAATAHRHADQRLAFAAVAEPSGTCCTTTSKPHALMHISQD